MITHFVLSASEPYVVKALGLSCPLADSIFNKEDCKEAGKAYPNLPFKEGEFLNSPFGCQFVTNDDGHFIELRLNKNLNGKTGFWKHKSICKKGANRNGGFWDEDDNCCQRRCTPDAPCDQGEGICETNVSFNLNTTQF